MAVTPKYKAKAVYWDSFTCTVVATEEIEKYRIKNRILLPEGVTRFDSQHEFRVYLELCRMYGAEKIVRQHPVGIFPPGLCYPKGKTWKVDFVVKDPIEPFKLNLFVEAKGAFLPEFGFVLAAAEHYQPEVFDNLYLVFGSSFPTENRIIRSLMNSSFDYRLLTLKELECLPRLPLPL